MSPINWELLVIASLLTIVGFLIVYVLNDIKGEISEMKASLKSIERDFRSDITSIKERLTIVETGCRIQHDSPD